MGMIVFISAASFSSFGSATALLSPAPEDNDNDGIDDSLEQFLAEKYAPVIYIEPNESNYPVNVDWILERAYLLYNEDCFPDYVEFYLNPIPDQPSLIGDQASLIGPPHTNVGHHCSDANDPQHRPISTIAADPQGEGPTGYSDQATFLLPDLNGIDRLGSLDPKDWVTYFHEYPTNDGGIMIQYWRTFAYNDFAGPFSDHGGDWDASIQVQLDSNLNLNGVWFSRHSDDHPGTFIPLSQITTYQTTHPLMTIDGGGHGSFASPLDWCVFNTGGLHLGTVIWSDNPDPAPGASSPVLRKVDGCGLAAPVFSDPVGGIVWKTWTDGMVKEYLPVTNPLLFETSNHGGLVNVGEYNPCTAITCIGSRQASSLLAGEFHPLNGQIFIRFEGRWGDLGIVNDGPRGPVFQGFDSGVYTAWYNQGSDLPASPSSSSWRQLPTTSATIIGSLYGAGGVNYVTSQTTISLTANQNPVAIQYGNTQIFYRFFQAGSTPPSFSTYSTPFSISGNDGVYQVDYYTVDALNNVESTQSQNLSLDNSGPIITITNPQSIQYVHSSSLILSYNTNDGSGSGLNNFTPKMDGATTLSGHGLQSGQSINLLTELSLDMHTFSIEAVDNLGNSRTSSVIFAIVSTPDSIRNDVTQFFASGDISKAGEENALLKMLDGASMTLSKSDCTAANKIYTAFINQLKAQSGKSVSPSAALIMIADAQYVISHCV